jgi:nitronate monooxygenase
MKYQFCYNVIRQLPQTSPLAAFTIARRKQMSFENLLTRRLSLSHPIIQAPLAGGGDTPELVAAVCEAGAIGFIGAAYLTPQQIAAAARTVKARTARPFGINLFAPVPAPDVPQDMGPALQRLAPFYAELGLPPPLAPAFADIQDGFEQQLAAALESGASAFSFTFGMLPPTAIDAIKGRGMFVMGTATTVEEGIALEQAGADAIIAQGSEAGGHRGTFAAEFADAMVGTMALVPQLVDAVSVPVIASGGIMDGRGIVAAMALGASAVQMGTAFLTCDEAGISEAYKEKILTAHAHQTRITRAFSGRPARGIVNRFMTEVEPAGMSDSVLPFPLQNMATRPLRNAAAKQGRAEYLSLWAGQGLGLARRQSAAELVARLGNEASQVMAAMAASVN